ncbi:MAG: type II toxin-antitoxin system RelE/ParE family toxin [Verrucomicrobiales bacterium]
MKYRVLTPALTELADAAEFYENEVSGLGADFLIEADSAIKRILSHPEAWGRISEDFQHCNFRRFPYTIIYCLERSDEILIVSVFNQKREPLSWRENL